MKQPSMEVPWTHAYRSDVVEVWRVDLWKERQQRHSMRQGGLDGFCWLPSLETNVIRPCK